MGVRRSSNCRDPTDDGKTRREGQGHDHESISGKDRESRPAGISRASTS
jgi:hypothetical protein